MIETDVNSIAGRLSQCRLRAESKYRNCAKLPETRQTQRPASDCHMLSRRARSDDVSASDTVFRVELIAGLPFALIRLLERPGTHWGSQYQVGAAIFLLAPQAREKTRSRHERGIVL